MKLRPYQNDCIDQTRQAMRNHRNVLLQAPTGAGKTAMASFMLRRVSERSKRGFFICHRRELIDQTAKTFDEAGIPYGFIAAGMPMNLYQPIQICSIDTLKNRLEKVPVPDFCIWDEAHHLGAAGWERVHEFYSDSFHVGLSATPSRLDGKGLGDRFDVLIPGPQVAWLIEQGFLARYKLFSVPGVDMSAAHTRMGEFVKSESQTAMDRPSITGNIIEHWKKHARDKLTIGFAVTCDHSKNLAAEFRAAGIMSVHLDGETPKAERKSALRALANGDIRVVWNVGLFGEGFDIAANSGLDVTVGCVIDASPTKSMGAWLQRCGRALRPQDQAVILDHSGNAMRHGLPCQEREWTLLGNRDENGVKREAPDISVKQCEECYLVFDAGTICPHCGHEHESGRKIHEVEGELEELTPEMMAQQQARQNQGRAETWEELVQIGHKRGVAKPERWASHIVEARREKDKLRTELMNLSIALESVGLGRRLSPYGIQKMKPKALRASIEELKLKLNPDGAARNQHTADVPTGGGQTKMQNLS